MNTKVLIFSAPSGAGKTTIVQHLLGIKEFNMSFSVSACSRQKRQNEVHGRDYYFLSVEKFKEKINNNEFLEWEEVYTDHFYGSLISEVERLSAEGKNVVFDVDVKGGLNIKKHYKENALAVFVMPPTIEELEKRLIARSTDNSEAIKTRIEKAKYEISFANQFDVVIINNELNTALSEAENIVRDFLK
ncbi:MAG: guanylate kinase [Bacteroidales bacterium]|nr:guanylate kinase [Bacteroidales bacterium]